MRDPSKPRRRTPKRKQTKKRSWKKRANKVKANTLMRKFVYVTDVTSNGTGPTYLDRAFYLNQVPSQTNFGTYAALYEQYRVCALKLTFYPAWTEDPEGSVLSVKTIPWFSLVDFNTTIATWTRQQYLVHNNHRVHYPFGGGGRGFSRYIPIPKTDLGATGVPIGWQNCDVTGSTTGYFSLGSGTDQLVYGSNQDLGVITATWYVKFAKARA